MIKGIEDKRGISEGKLKHIMLGTVKNLGQESEKVSGYHCYKECDKTEVIAEVEFYPKSKRIITENKNQRIFEAVVRGKETKK